MEKSIDEVPSDQAKKRKSIARPNSRGEKKKKRSVICRTFGLITEVRVVQRFN